MICCFYVPVLIVLYFYIVEKTFLLFAKCAYLKDRHRFATSAFRQKLENDPINYLLYKQNVSIFSLKWFVSCHHRVNVFVSLCFSRSICLSDYLFFVSKESVMCETKREVFVVKWQKWKKFEERHTHTYMYISIRMCITLAWTSFLICSLYGWRRLTPYFWLKNRWKKRVCMCTCPIRSLQLIDGIAFLFISMFSV